MKRQDPPTFDFSTEEDVTDLLPLSTETHTIDLGEGLSSGLTVSGSFDISTIEGTVLAKLLHALPTPAMLLDDSCSIKFCNESWSRFGADYGKLQGIHVSVLFGGAGTADKTCSVLEQIFRDRRPRVMAQRLQVGSKQIWARMFLRTVRVAGQRLILCLVEDLTLEKRQILLMDIIRRAKTEWEQTVDVVSEGIALIDSEHRIIRLNKAMSSRAGVAIQEAIGQPCYRVVHETDKPPYFCPLSKARNENKTCSVDYRQEKTGAFFRESVSPVKAERAGLRGCVLVIQDMTEHKRLEEQLQRYATRDDLTDLYNRRQTIILLEAACKSAARYAQPLSLCLFDIDNFKRINDEHGHHAGDRVLAAFAGILKKQLRGADIVGRYGGDEFIMGFPNTSLERAAQTLTRIRSMTDQSEFHDGNTPYKVSFSAGLVQLSQGEALADVFIREADKALYEAKARGRNCVVCSAAGKVEWQF